MIARAARTRDADLLIGLEIHPSCTAIVAPTEAARKPNRLAKTECRKVGRTQYSEAEYHKSRLSIWVAIKSSTKPATSPLVPKQSMALVLVRFILILTLSEV